MLASLSSLIYEAVRHSKQARLSFGLLHAPVVRHIVGKLENHGVVLAKECQPVMQSRLAIFGFGTYLAVGCITSVKARKRLLGLGYSQDEIDAWRRVYPG